MKRKTAVILSVLLMTGAFSGCGNTESSEEAVTTTSSAVTTAATTTTAAATTAAAPAETTTTTTEKPDETSSENTTKASAETTAAADETTTSAATSASDKVTSGTTATSKATTVKTTTTTAKTTTKSPVTTTAKTTTKAATTTTKKPATTTAKAPDSNARRVVLPVKNIQMLPELPSGSEVTSAAMILNYFGFNVSKMELIDYLPIYKDPAPVNGIWGNPYFVFVGHPTKSKSVGYERVLKKCIDAYFAKNNITDYEANISGTSFYEYIQEIKKGNLVMMWVTVGMKDPVAGVENEWETDDGYRYLHIQNSNCVVMTGFDLDKNTVIICDPADPKGTVEYPMDKVEEIHKTMGYQSVIIRKK